MSESRVGERPAREKAKPTRTTKRVEIPRPAGEAPTNAYAWFLELPVALVLAVLWVVGAVLGGLCGAALYLVVTTMVQVFAGVV
jgi:hypothetical protein